MKTNPPITWTLSYSVNGLYKKIKYPQKIRQLGTTERGLAVCKLVCERL